MLNDFLSRERNICVREGLHIPRGALLSTGEMLDIAPGIGREGLSGGALWHDCIAEDTERLTLGFVGSAVEHGARAANYVKAENYITEKNAIVGVEARDLINGTEMTIRARVVADATDSVVDNDPTASRVMIKIDPLGFACCRLRHFAVHLRQGTVDRSGKE